MLGARTFLYCLLLGSWLLFAGLGAALAVVPWPGDEAPRGLVQGLLYGALQWCLVAGLALATVAFERMLGAVRRWLSHHSGPPVVGPRLPW